MATFERGSRQYPPKIQGLLKSMRKAEIRIKKLKEQLNTAKSEYDRLELEWADYKASVAPIRACPPEVLSMIFHFYLLENPHLVRRLLLVCKQWYSLVVNDPRVWNRISVTVPDEWDIESAAEPIERRINHCLQRSGTLLLELDLDLSDLRSAGDQIIEKIRMCFIHQVSEEDWNTLYDWSQGLDLAELLISPTTTTYPPEPMLKVVQQLVGKRGEIMARWGTLNLHLPESNMPFVMVIWQIFAWPAPNLSRMVIACNEIMGEYVDELTVGFPEIPSLKHLDIDEMESLEFLKLENSSLESLVIYRGVAFWDGIGLSQFTQLQRLEVTQMNSSSGTQERFSIHLPKLRHLILNGDITNLDRVDFRVPVVYTLDLVRWGHSGFHPLPKLQSLHVRWKNEGWLINSWSPIVLLAEMRRILVQFDTAMNLTIDEFARSALIEVVQSLHANGQLPNAIQTIVVIKPNGEEDTLPVTSLC